MRNALKKGRLAGALMGTMALLLLGLVLGPVSAQASTSSYCGNQTLPGYGYCQGAYRMLYQVYGWGDQHSVCVAVSLAFNASRSCSSGPEVGVYSERLSSAAMLDPYISNNAAGSNTVHGVAFQP